MAQTSPHHDIEEVRGGDDLVPLPRQHLLSLQAAVEVGEEVGVVLQITMNVSVMLVVGSPHRN